MHDVQDLEKRIMDGTATDEEAMVKDNHDIAVKGSMETATHGLK
jgi:hypothetical protein